jgi:hypothetical protein
MDKQNCEAEAKLVSVNVMAIWNLSFDSSLMVILIEVQRQRCEICYGDWL